MSPCVVMLRFVWSGKPSSQRSQYRTQRVRDESSDKEEPEEGGEQLKTAERLQHSVRPLRLAFGMPMLKRVLLQGEQTNILAPCPLDLVA